MKERLDVLLTKLDPSLSREKAKAVIMSGDVFVNGQRLDKAGAMVDETASVEVKARLEFVSRGGYKLKKAVESFGLNLEGKKCIDVGASTGGFTDCMLKNGAEHVIAVDVGYGQFDYNLRKDPRVTCMERTNIRNVKAEDLEYQADFAAVDVAFISLTKVLPVLINLMKPEFEIICLIKPQFEAGKDQVGKNGVVRDKKVQTEVIRNIADFAFQQGCLIKGLDYSPIKGPKGNVEFLIHLLRRGVDDQEIILPDIEKLVDDARENAQ